MRQGINAGGDTATWTIGGRATARLPDWRTAGAASDRENVLRADRHEGSMELAEIESMLESSIPESTATVSRPRGPDDDDHYAVTVVSPAFEDESLVSQHERVYDALEDHLTTDIHAVEITTRTPRE